MIYYPPSYFPTDFYGAANPVPGSAGTPDAPITSDAVALAFFKTVLETSGLFAAVGLGRMARPTSGQSYPGAWIYPVGFRELDDVDPVEIVRVLRYAVVIWVRPENPESDVESFQQLDALSNQTANLLDSLSPEGVVDGLTRIEGGRYDILQGTLTDPLSASGAASVGSDSLGLTLFGEVAYLVEGRSGRGLPQT